MVEPELAAGADGVELDALDSPPDAAFVSDFASDFVSAFVAGFLSPVESEAAPSLIDELLFDA